MNYAEDRLDRHTYNDSTSEEFLSYYKSLTRTKQSHQALAKYLRDTGSNIQAAFHYAVAWIEFDKYNSEAAGDYAQMLEFCGCPDLGANVLFLFYELLRSRTIREDDNDHTDNITNLIDDDLFQNHLNNAHDHTTNETPVYSEDECNCGLTGCASNDIQFHSRLISNLQKNLLGLSFENGNDFNEDQWVLNCVSVIFKNHSLHEEEFTSLLKLLLMKLLYVSSLPHYGGVRMAYSQAACNAMNLFEVKQNDNLKLKHKSHWAYYIFMKVLITRKVKTNVARTQPIFKVKDTSSFVAPPALFILGDSHILSAGWQTVCLKLNGETIKRVVTPILIPGIKAWHCRKETKFFTNTNLKICLHRLKTSFDRSNQRRKTILFSAGEIDCREGIGRERLEGYKSLCEDAVVNTIKEFVKALESYASDIGGNIQILILPVPPHGRRSHNKGKTIAREMRRKRSALWNLELRKVCRKYNKNGIFFLDYWEQLSSGGADKYELYDKYNADFTHMNAGFITLMEKAIQNCGCNLALM